jgi:hypothetical protein
MSRAIEAQLLSLLASGRASSWSDPRVPSIGVSTRPATARDRVEFGSTGSDFIIIDFKILERDSGGKPPTTLSRPTLTAAQQFRIFLTHPRFAIEHDPIGTSHG